MRRFVLLILVVGCGRTALPSDVDGGSDAGTPDAGRDAGVDAGTRTCGVTPPGALLTWGPRITLPLENPKLIDGVMTPAGRVIAIIDAMNSKLLLVGPTWQREIVESTTELARVHLAWNGEQLALTWQAGQRLMFALFDANGTLQHQRQLGLTAQADELVAGFADGTWFPVWTNASGMLVDAWATRIYPDGGDQNLVQKVTMYSAQLGVPASGISAIVTDAGISALVLADTAQLAVTDLFPSHLNTTFLASGSRGRGALVDFGAEGLSAVYFSNGPNSRRPELVRFDFAPDGGVRNSTIANEPSLFSVQDVAAAACGRRLVVAYTDDTTGAGPCLGNYCYKPLLHVRADLDGGDWRSPETDGGYVRSATILRNGESLDVAWLSAREDGSAQVTIAPALITCCEL